MPDPKLEDYHLSAAHDCLFNVFATNLDVAWDIVVLQSLMELFYFSLLITSSDG
jgi:hypothetical protein